jgi:predicted negative regulator of RcsB-dependent stress response
MPSIPDNTPLWLTIAVFVFMAMLAVFQWRSASKVQSADATQKIGSAYDQLLDNMKKQLDELESDVAYLKKELRKYSNWSARLVKQLVDNGIEPIPPPDTGELMKGPK